MEFVRVKRKNRGVKVEKTFREISVALSAGVSIPINFSDTRPNHIVITNGSTGTVYISRSANVGTSNYDYMVLPGQRFQCIFGMGINQINAIGVDSGSIGVQSYEAELDPVAVALANMGDSVSSTIVGSLANQITLQSNAIDTGTGTPHTSLTDETLTFTISGASTSRTIIFEIADPVKGVYQNLALPTKLGDTTYTPQLQTAGGSDTLPETWQVDIPANFSFRARISVAPVGGNVNISGYTKAVIS